MFKGEVLSTNGWKVPQVGDVIARLDDEEFIVWDTIKQAHKAEGDFLCVESSLIHYAVSLDHELAILKGRKRHNLLAGDLYDMWNKSPSKQVKISHFTYAYPRTKRCSQSSVIKSFAIEEAGGRMISQESAFLFRNHLEYRLFYPNAYLMGSHEQAPYKMCQRDAIELLSLLFPLMKGHDCGKSPKPKAPVRTYRTAGYNILQAACFFFGITSTVSNGVVKLYLIGRKGKYPVRPTITPATKVEIKRDTGWSIDINHPVVRLSGKVVVL